MSGHVNNDAISAARFLSSLGCVNVSCHRSIRVREGPNLFLQGSAKTIAFDFQIIVRLKIQPKSFGRVKVSGEPQRSVGCSFGKAAKSLRRGGSEPGRAGLRHTIAPVFRTRDRAHPVRGLRPAADDHVGRIESPTRGADRAAHIECPTPGAVRASEPDNLDGVLIGAGVLGFGRRAVSSGTRPARAW